MKKLAWNPKLSMHDEKIDDQHKELIRIANGLMHAVYLGRSELTLRNVLSKLREYTVFHFSSEEALMETMGFRKRGEHAVEHIRLKGQVKEFQHRLFRSDVITADDVLVFMKSWLLEHLLTFDMEFASFIKEDIEAKEREKSGQEEEKTEEADGAENGRSDPPV